MSRKRSREESTPNEPSNVLLQQGSGGQQGSLVSIWRSAEMCDAEVIVAGKSFRAHRVILAAGSAYMRGVFNSGMKESQSSVVTLPDMSAAVFEAVLEWCYAGSAKVPETILVDVLTAAVRLQAPTLQTATESELIERLDANNCLDAWQLGDSLTLSRLVDAACCCAGRLFEEVAKSDAFATLPAPRLLKLLKRDELGVAREEE
eukprot:2858839-Prymnesium_polylepis.1